MASKTLKLYEKALKDLDFTYEGSDGHNELVFRHPAGVTVRGSASTNNRDHNAAQLRRRAQTALRNHDTFYGQFGQFILDDLGIRPDEKRFVQLHCASLGKRYYDSVDSPPKLSKDPSNWLRALQRHPQFELVKARRGNYNGPLNGVSDWNVTGLLYGINQGGEPWSGTARELMEEAEARHAAAAPTCDAALEMDGGGLAICGLAPGHTGDHLDKLRHVSWSQVRIEGPYMEAEGAYDLTDDRYDDPDAVVGEPPESDSPATEPVTEAPTPPPSVTESEILAAQALIAARKEGQDDAQAAVALVREALDAIAGRLAVLSSDVDQLREMIRDAQ